MLRRIASPDAPTVATVIEPADKGKLRKAKKLVRLLPRRRYRRALRIGVAAAIEHEEVAFDHSFRTVLDVGSHTGQFALFALERFPGARLWCFEPLEAERRVLERVVGSAATVVPAAAGAQEGPVTFHVSRATDSSSLRPITSNYTSAFHGTDEVGLVTVDVRRLDDVVGPDAIERPVLLKIDVQGGEGDVLAGAQRVLTEVDEAYVECSFVEFYEGQILADDVVALMRDAGLRLTGAYGVVRDRNGRTLQADLLFSRTVVRAPGTPSR